MSGSPRCLRFWGGSPALVLLGARRASCIENSVLASGPVPSWQVDVGYFRHLCRSAPLPVRAGVQPAPQTAVQPRALHPAEADFVDFQRIGAFFRAAWSVVLASFHVSAWESPSLHFF